MRQDTAQGVLVRAIAVRRMRVALVLTALLLVIYLGFMLLVAFAKGLLAFQFADGLSLALVLAVLTILSGWVLAIIYVRWANRYHDDACERLGEGGR